MYEFFVKLEIRESVDMAGESDERLRLAVAEIAAWIERTPSLSPLDGDGPMRAGVQPINHATTLVAFGATATPADRPPLRDLLELMARVAPGSFGFAYAIDHDVDPTWTVLVLKRGRITIEADPFLSPPEPARAGGVG